MADVEVTPTNLQGNANPAYVSPTLATLSSTPGEKATWKLASGKDIAIVKATGIATVRLKSVADHQGRVKDEDFALINGDFLIVGPVNSRGWQQSNGEVHIERVAGGGGATVAVLRGVE